jgi:hypothetical protein
MYFKHINFVDSQGKAVENEMKKLGSGDATFIFADVTNEDDVKVLH